MLGERYDLFRSSVTMTASDTEYEVPIPADAREFLGRVSGQASTWRWSQTRGEVAAGGGFPLASAEDLVFDGPLAEQVLYVACDDAGKSLHFTYLTPHRARP